MLDWSSSSDFVRITSIVMLKSLDRAKPLVKLVWPLSCEEMSACYKTQELAGSLLNC